MDENLSEFEDSNGDKFEPNVPPYETFFAVDNANEVEDESSTARQSSSTSTPQYPTTTQPTQERKFTTTRTTRKRIWKQAPFVDKPHNYIPLPTKPVRRPIEYFRDYIDNTFTEQIAHCTNLYYSRNTGRELKSTNSEITKLIAIQIIMGCIPYPRLSMYWRASTRLEIISNLMSRDRFLTLRNALHVVDSHHPTESEIGNPLWKVQPMIDQIQRACNKIERVPGFYSIGEQTIPFIGSSRRVMKHKSKPVGLKNFVLTTSEGLMLDFHIYKGAKDTSIDTNLGVGPSVILELAKSIPPGSCVHHDQNFTTIPLIEEMEQLNLHSTGTIMLNRIPDRTTIKIKTHSEMVSGDIQQFVCEPTAIINWKDKKTVLLASNCTGANATTLVKRRDEISGECIEVAAPKIVKEYYQHVGGSHVLEQQMEYYRSVVKTKKWTLKVLIHFLDLALVNSWRLYKNDCISSNLPNMQTMPLLDFRLAVADALSCTPDRPQNESEDDSPLVVPHCSYKVYRPANVPSIEKRYDGYEHYPISDEIKAPRSCRLETCSSRSKIRCEKCNVYLCLSRAKRCFKTYHTQ